ncbi:universal stress protein [Thermocoleostomius sinensis]|jgi:nucleotide-binding universal stress UspA family protein|uniref:Universal stress protein n=1 Tax=Thermocoleostomius sinensis A174 TaxID=2016057 RepID=A0A9E8ZJY0_9CYAN|nr:universal stress protein [Thermocoleostomius sinensis]WAL62580.1 universal stress protein [Thermocoleostomius sinensis A174]
MFQRILVAVDDSPISEQAFNEALDLAKQSKAALLLLHVLSSNGQAGPVVPTLIPYYYPIVTDAVIEQYREQWEAAERRGLERLRSLATQATSLGIPTEFTQNIGNPGPLICQVAQDWQADLIVLGRRGHSGLNEWLMGSVSNYVMHHAACPVLAVQGATPSSRHAMSDEAITTR